MRFHAPEIPVINNVDVAAQTDVDAIRDALVRQLHSPVRWVETIQALAADDVSIGFECGPGKVLAGLVKRIAPGLSVTAMDNRAAFDAALVAQGVEA